jgi:SAM-dependent methyltransferase
VDSRVRLSGFASRTHLHCRRARWQTYCTEFPPEQGQSILDIGVSPLVDLPGENHFLRSYPFPDRVTTVSSDSNLDPVRTAFPEVTVLTADGLDLPFGDRSFDIAHSNAVIEHVGPRDAQVRFLAETIRVGHAGFVSTPDRWFPLDSHTNLPVLHWLPRRAFLATLRRLGRLAPGEEWVTWLLSSRQFQRLAPSNLELRLVRQRLMGMTAVVTLIFRHPAEVNS